MENSRAYLLRMEITKSHLNNRICQHCGVKASTVTPSFYYVFNISLPCNINIPSFIGNLWWVILLGNHLNRPFATNDHLVQNPPCWRASSLLSPHWDIKTKRPQPAKLDWLLFLITLSSMADFVPCDRLLQKAYFVQLIPSSC